MTSDNPATVTVVTGPDGHDIGPAVAHLGRNLGDGLTVRIEPRATHTSPVPGAWTVQLDVLPSAWQNPDTNLGVIRRPRRGDPFNWHDAIRGDLRQLDQLGLHPGHRLTIEGLDGLRCPPGCEPCEPGGLAVAARDSVLRGAGPRQVLLEAGDGQTFLDAMATLGLPPWSPHIERLELWLVIDVTWLAVTPDHGTVAESVATLVADEVTRQGSVPTAVDRVTSLRLALLGFDDLLPELAGVDTAGLARDPADGGAVTHEVGDRLGGLLILIEDRAGAPVSLLGTGPGCFIDVDR